jgi:ferritin
MMISKKMSASLNEQIGNELGAAMQYMAMGNHFAAESLPMFAAHFYKQGDEEREHALKISKFVLDTGGRVEIPAISAPKNTFKCAEEAVQQALDWEKTVTKQINELIAQAVKENDYTTQNFLAWFTTEQVEEVSSMENLLAMVKRAGEAGLFHVEGYLARQGK